MGDESSSSLPALTAETKDELRKTTRDRIAAYIRAAAGGLPYIGPVVDEVIGELIPNQRIDRIAKMLAVLEEKVSRLQESEKARDRMLLPESVDLIEDGMQQAARALSDERLERIATVLKNSLSDTELEYLQKKTLVSLLGELNDAEILILKSYGLRPQKAKEFRERHRETIYGPSVHMGSSQEEIDKAAIHDAFRRKLERLGLIRPRYQKPSKSRELEFDFKTGRVKSRGNDLTSLGRLLLRYLDEEVER